MKIIRTALIDVIKTNNRIVFIKGKSYQISKDTESNKLYVQGEDSLLYLLEDHPDWFGETSGILPFIV